MLEHESPSHLCRICSNARGVIHTAREMMFGLGMEFKYLECEQCGSLWLTERLDDIDAYYPPGYYSLAGSAKRKTFRNRFLDYLLRRRNASYFERRGLLGRFLAQRYGNAELLAVSKLKLEQDSKILDVGCGNGKLLFRLHELGFQNLLGIDPYLARDVEHANGVRIRKCHLHDLVEQGWDAIMFHHSLEHVPDPFSTLQAAVSLLAPSGQCLVRLPVVSWAWKHYGSSWVQLDPPRHMWLPTEKAMRMLAHSAGLRVERVEYDSTEFQFWGSELYARNIALNNVNPRKLNGFFERREMAEFRQRAKALNSKNQGDQAAFWLRRPQRD